MSSHFRNRIARLLVGEYLGLLAVLALLVAFFGTQTPYFFTVPTLTAIVNQIPALMLVAVGMTFVLITGGIDLAVGSVLAFSASVLGVLMVEHGVSIWMAVPATILVGACCGLVSGAVSVLAGIPSFIVSLGVLQITRGLAYVLTDSTSIYVNQSTGIQFIGGRIAGFGVSPAFLFAFSVVLVSQFVLHRTLFGRYCMAIGFNETVVRLSGVNTARVRIGAFVLCGALAAAAGIVETSRLSAVDPNAAIGFELSAIAAAVIGGTSLMGGRGSMTNTFLGVLIIAVLQTGLIQMGVSEGAKYITTGCVIVVAVLLDASRTKFSGVMRHFFGD
ncbi:MAG TPA: ABC transporter permease [Planctomycetes bacterium]|nr:ABC transporter permease [Planctomycetota bacterium]